MIYKIIYADPAWQYKDVKGAEKHYNTLNIEQIKQLPINEIADNDCILFMWATFPKIQEALDVIKAWGFTLIAFFGGWEDGLEAMPKYAYWQ